MDKVEEILKNLNEGIEKLSNKEFSIYFFVHDWFNSYAHVK